METKFRIEFTGDHIESYTSWESMNNEIVGMIVCKSFDFAFELLTQGLAQGSGINGVKFKHPSYVDWSWINIKCPNIGFFSAIDEKLNDDCIREIIKYVDLCHLIYFGTINKRFNGLIQERLKNIYIFPSSVGSIDIMNLRYILHISKDSLKELTISLACFPTVYGIHSHDKKNAVLETIQHFAGEKLKKVCLHGFNLNEYTSFSSNKLTERGLKVEQKVEESKPIRCTVSFTGNLPNQHFF